MQLSKQNNPLLLLSLISFLHPSLSPLCSLGQDAWVSVMDFLQIYPTPLYPTGTCAFGPAEPLTTNASWQWQSWCFSCQPCSLPSFWSLHGIQELHWHIFAELDIYQVGTEYWHCLFFYFCFASSAPEFSHLISLYWSSVVFLACIAFVQLWFLTMIHDFCLFSLQGIRGDEETMLATHCHPTFVLFKAMELCAPAKGSGAKCRKPEDRVCFTAWHLKCRIIRNVCILKCFILCFKDSVSGRGKIYKGIKLLSLQAIKQWSQYEAFK